SGCRRTSYQSDPAAGASHTSHDGHILLRADGDCVQNPTGTLGDRVKTLADGPFFISYSRRDYYFAESLALPLMRRGVPFWLDVKGRDRGGLWEQDLDAALDRAAAVILVVSPDSMKTVNVRKEWVRARDRGKRIVIAYFRRAQLPPELADCEAVDFRASFTPS